MTRPNRSKRHNQPHSLIQLQKQMDPQEWVLGFFIIFWTAEEITGIHNFPSISTYVQARERGSNMP